MRAIVFTALTLAACGFAGDAAQSQPVPQSAETGPAAEVEPPIAISPASAPPYKRFLDTVRQEREAPDADPKALLYRYIQKDMPAYWDDTGWDFNGTSRVPGEGDIACGYFVTTLLQDLGFSIARIRMAQEPSATMIKKFTSNIKVVNSREAMVRYVETQPVPGVYIVGLDFHTGFITSGESGINFVHSNYIGRAGVMTEPAAESDALAQSGYFMIGSLTENTVLMNKWRQRP